MKYIDFKNKYNKLPYFYSSSFVGLGEPIQSIRKQLNEWCKKHLVIQLRRGIYTINDSDKPMPTERTLIANSLVEPSYLSLEYALSYYGFIPERVDVLTSITTHKTQQFSNAYGVFVYHHIKEVAYTGFIEQKTKAGYSFFIATPEKAITDFLYYNLSKISMLDKNIFEDSYRFQNLESVDIQKLRQYGKIYGSIKLSKIIESFITFSGESSFEEI